jgi:hypothetical protein
MKYSYSFEYGSTNKFGQADGLSRLPVGIDEDFHKQDICETRMVEIISKEIQKDLVS